MDANNDQKKELTGAYRQHVRNAIISKMMEWFKDDPKLLSQIREVATRFESTTFQKSTCKEDYVAKIQEKMRLTQQKYHSGASKTIGSNQQQMMNKMGDKQVTYSNQSPNQNLNIGSSSSQENRNPFRVSQRTMTTSPNQLHQGRPAVPRSEGLHHPSMQQQMQQPFRTTNVMLNTGQCSQQPSQVASTVVKKEQLRMQEMSRPAIAEGNKHVSQLQIASSTSSLDAKTIYEAERKRLMDKCDDARRTKMPLLMTLKRLFDDGSIKPHTAADERFQQLKLKVGHMIDFLKCDESALKRLSNQILRQQLHILDYIVNWYYRSARSSQKQASQVSSGQTSVNHLQIQNPETSAPDSQSHAANTPSNASHLQLSAPYAPMQCPSLKRNPEPMKSPGINQPHMLQLKKPQQELEKVDFMDSMFLPKSKGNSSKAQSQLSRGHPSSSKQFLIQKRTRSVINPRASSQKESSIVAVGDLANFEVTAAECEIEVQDTNFGMGVSGTLVPSMSSDFCDQSNQRLKSIVLPFERLTKAILSIPSEILEAAKNDISSAFLEMDELPKYAFHDESKAVDDYLVDFHQEMNISTGDKRKRLKRDSEIKSVDAATTLNNHDSYMERPWKAANHDLVVAEVVDINKELIETWVEVTPGSESDSNFGTIVRCLYMPIAFSDELKIRFVSIVPLSILSVELLVPPHYPEFSPIILDSSRLPDGCSLKGEVLLGSAREMFHRSVRALNSVAEMAKAWDYVARETFTNLAIRLGGKTFEDRYGVWRKVPAE